MHHVVDIHMPSVMNYQDTEITVDITEADLSSRIEETRLLIVLQFLQISTSQQPQL